MQLWEFLSQMQANTWNSLCPFCLESKQTLIFEVGKAFAAKLGGKGMSSSALQNDAPDLVCQLDNVQGIVDALSSVRWKRHQVSLSRNFFLGFLP